MQYIHHSQEVGGLRIYKFPGASMFSLLGAFILYSSISVSGQALSSPISISDISTGRTADASFDNMKDVEIVLQIENQRVTSVTTVAETDFVTPQAYARPSTDSTEADASIRNQGRIFGSALGYGLVSGIESKVDASINVSSTNGASTANTNALGDIVNEGEIHLENGGNGLAAIIRADSTAASLSSFPRPSLAYASSVGSGVIRNYSDIHITHSNLNLSKAIITDVKVEGDTWGSISWTTPPAPDPSELIYDHETYSLADGSVENHGNLSLNTAGFGSSYAIQAQAEAVSTGYSGAGIEVKAVVMNTGNISMEVFQGFYVYGIHTEASSRSGSTGELSSATLGSVQNYGDIYINIIDSLGAYGIRTEAKRTTFGEDATVTKLIADTSVSNSGSIEIHSSGSSDAFGVYTTSTVIDSYGGVGVISEVNNSGSIHIEAYGSEINPVSGNATGVYFENGGSLHSSGRIEAYSESGTSYHVVSEKDLTITGYAIQFGSNVISDYTGVIKAEESALFDDAILFASISEDFVGGVYEIPELVEGSWEGADNGGAEEQFTSVVSQIELPDFQVELLPADSSSGQRVDIRYAPSASFANTSMRLTGDLIQQATFRLRQRQLLSAHSNLIVSDDDEVGGFSLEHETSVLGGQLYGSPVYSNSRADSDPVGYRAATYGFELGYNYGFSDRFNLGLIGGYGESSVDYTGVGFDRRSEDTELIYGGLDGALRLSDRLALLGSSIYYDTSNSYEDRSPSNLESADYRGRGLNSSLSLTYKLPIADTRHWLRPRVGISHLWQDRDSFVTSNEVTADVAYEDISEDHFYSHWGVDWNHRYELENWTISPHLSLEVRKVLGDDDLSHDMSVGNSYSRVTDTRDSLLYQGLGSISIYRENCELTAGVAVHEGDESSAYALWLRVVQQF